MKKKEYSYEVTRFYNLDKIKAWYMGESEDLPKLIGTGFKKTIFVCKNGAVDFYYNSKEVEAFEKALESKIGEKEFGKICANFILLVEKMKKCKINKEKLKIFSKMVPALTLFNEFDEYPEYMEGNMKEMLFEVRSKTHAVPYELLRDVGLDKVQNFIYFEGRVYTLK
ncbi:MAG: hypothetical protein NUV46_01160 [Nanoarchaeota archaeon]|nr:hypothetical protein [Nanoarchaeota archaeon]